MPNDIELNDVESAAFNVEAVRAFMFTQAVQVAEGMKEQGAANADAALLTGSLEFAIQLWVQVSIRAGVPAQKAWLTLHHEARALFQKHVDQELSTPEGASVQ